MATILPWLNLLAVLAALLLTLTGSLWWAEAAYTKKADCTRQRGLQRWLPLRMSNSLMLLAAVYYVLVCAQSPPCGSAVELFGCTLTIAAGAVLSAKGY